MRTRSLIRVQNWLALAGILLFCLGPSATAQTKQKQPSTKNQQQSASGHASPGQEAGPPPHGLSAEDENYLRAREEWFLEGRRLPDGSVGAGMRLKAIQRLDEMIEAEKKMGLLPPDGAVPPVTGFPGSATWTLIGPQPINVPPPQSLFPFNGSPLNSGRVSAMAVDPKNPDIVYLGAAAGGVWKTINGGTTWIPLTDQQLSLSTGSIAIDPTANSCGASGPCQIIYVGTGEANFSGDSYYGAGVLKSADGGNTWTQQGASVFVGIGSASRLDGGAHIGALAVDPFNNQIVIAGAVFVTSSGKSGFYRSTDGGNTWIPVATLSGAAATSIVFDPTNSGVVYAALGAAGGSALNGVYRSTDHGATWTKMVGSAANTFPTSGVGRIDIDLARSSPTTLYALVANSSGSSLLGLFKTLDANLGSTADWIQQTNTPDFCTDPIVGSQCFYDLVVRVHPANANIVFAGGATTAFDNSKALERSTSGGATWESVANGANSVNLHVDLHALAFSDPASGPVRLYIGNDGGAWRTDNPSDLASAVNYNNLNTALAITMSYPGHGVHPSDENIGFVGTQDNGTQRFSGNLAWDLVTPGDGGQTAIDPQVLTVVYTTCQFICIFRSVFDGTSPGSFTFNTNGITRERSNFVAPLTHDPNTAGRLYFGTFRVYLSADFAETWTAISPDLTTSSFRVLTAIAVAPSDSNVVYVGTNAGSASGSRISTSTNALLNSGATWTNITSAAVLPTNRSVSAIAVDKNNSSLVYVTYTGFTFGSDTKGHVFRSPDGGTTWQDISGTGVTALPNIPVNDIAADPDLSDTLYVATDLGVFSTSNASAGPGTIWSPLGTGLPKVVVLNLNLRRQSRILRASTSGRSTWILQLTNLAIPAGPLLTSVHPSSTAPGSSLPGVILDGANFTATSKVQFDGSQTGVTTHPGTANQMTADFDVSLLTPGVHNITVFDSTQTPNTSGNLRFSVTNAVPSITSLSPSSAAPGGPGFTLTVNGTNFNCSGGTANSVVRFNGTNHTPATCSATAITVNIAASEIATGGLLPVLVFTPPPGGGDSNTVFFPVAVPPPNDDFINAIAPPGNSLPFTDTQDSTAATTDTGGRVDPTPSAACVSSIAGAGRFHTIWYKFTPASTVSLTATTAGSSYDTVLDVVTGSPGSFTEVACNDDFGGTVQSQVTFTANAGTAYFFMIGGFDNSQAGTTVFHLSVTGAAPPNDNFGNAMNASPRPFTDVEDTTAATTEAGEPVPPGSCTIMQSSSTKSIWYKFTAPSKGTISADTHGSNYDTILQAVTESLGSFTSVACNDDTSFFDLTSQISFSATSGTTFFFMISAFAGDGGSSVFHLSFNPAPPAVTLSPSPVAFGNQVVGVASTPQMVTLTNSGGATLNIISIAVTGTNAGDFALSATGTTPCPFGPSSLPAGSSCTFNVTFTPGATGSRSANVTVISNASTSPDNDPLSGTGVVDFTVAAAAPSTQTVTAGGTGTFTINVATVGGTLPNPITLTASGLPPASTGSFNPASFPAGSNGGSSTFTVTTTKGSAVPPLSAPRPQRPFVLLWLLAGLLVLAALLLLRQGIRTRRLALYLPLVLLLLSAAVVVGCGGGGGIPGTPPGTYNISITATSGSATHTTTVTLIVN